MEKTMENEIKVVECTERDLASFCAVANAEGVSLAPKGKSRYVIAYYEGMPAGCAALAMIGKTRARLFGAFVLPDFRGKGVWTEMYYQRIAMARLAGATVVDAFVRKTIVKSYFKRGFYKKRFFKGLETTHVERDING